MAKQKASYALDGNVIFRSGVPIADIVDGRAKMREGCEKYALPAAKMVPKTQRQEEQRQKEPVKELPPVEQAIPEKDIPTADPSVGIEAVPEKTEVEEIPKEKKDPMTDKYPVAPSLQKRADELNAKKHNPFGFPVKDVPPCPSPGEAGTKDPAVVAWVKKYYPQEAEILYADWERKKEYIRQKAEYKAEKARRAKAEWEGVEYEG